MIVEVAVVTAGVVICSSLGFAWRVLKMQAKADAQPAPAPQIWPNTHPYDNPACPFCGTRVRSDARKDERHNGVREVGKACPSPTKCECKEPHLHAECVTCKVKFFMTTANKPIETKYDQAILNPAADEIQERVYPDIGDVVRKARS